MYIERIQIEAEGFLAGLDLRLTSGLNVVIGARGTGKTSLIELLRFCLDAGAFTDDAGTKGRQQAIATLGGGAVTATLRSADAVYSVSRSASGRTVSTDGRRFPCTVLAQNEVEAVGAQAAGRLHLIDRFRDNRSGEDDVAKDLRARVASLTAELVSILGDGLELTRRVKELEAVPAALAEARLTQQALLENSSATAQDREQLALWQAASQTISAREAVIVESIGRFTTFDEGVRRLAADVPTLLQGWPEDDPDDPLAGVRPVVNRLEVEFAGTLETLATARTLLQTAVATNNERKGTTDERTRELRQALEAIQVGLEGATRRVSELEERQGQLLALQSAVTERRNRFTTVSENRDALYAKLDQIRDSVFDERTNIAAELNKRLGPAIRIRVTQSENIEDYRAAVISGLRGSGLHYNTLAPILTERLSPYELTTWVELGQTEQIARALDITTERASALTAAFRQAGLADVITARIDDGVALDLLDGRDYKPSDRLSIGQRCTVVLPLLLGHHGDPLVVDQPEDHLDNAFIASTLVPALRSRSDDDQFIFSSHNANIPVLGNADNIVVLESDGDRGYIAHQGPLEDTEIVQAVTRLMEGGAEAFAARAKFYGHELQTRTR